MSKNDDLFAEFNRFKAKVQNDELSHKCANTFLSTAVYKDDYEEYELFLMQDILKDMIMEYISEKSCNLFVCVDNGGVEVYTGKYVKNRGFV